MATPLDDARTALLERLGLERPPRDFEEALTHSSYANEHRRSASWTTKGWSSWAMRCSTFA